MSNMNMTQDEARYGGMNTAENGLYNQGHDRHGMAPDSAPVDPATQTNTASNGMMKPPVNDPNASGSDSALPEYRNSRTSWGTAEKREGETEGQVGNLFDQGGQNYRTVGRWMSGIILITKIGRAHV